MEAFIIILLLIKKLKTFYWLENYILSPAEEQGEEFRIKHFFPW